MLTFAGDVLDVQQAADLPVPGRPPLPGVQPRRQPSGLAGSRESSFEKKYDLIGSILFIKFKFVQIYNLLQKEIKQIREC